MLPRPSLLKMLLTGAYIVACSSAHCYGWHLNQLCQVCPYCTLDWNQMQGCNHCHHGFLHKFRSLQYHDAAEHSHSVCVCAMHPVPFCDLLRVIVSTRFLLSSSVACFTGLFIPSLALGASWGRIVGMCVRYMVGSHVAISLPSYAVISLHWLHKIVHHGCTIAMLSAVATNWQVAGCLSIHMLLCYMLGI